MSNDDARWHLAVVNTHFNRHRRAGKLHQARERERKTSLIEKKFCTDLIIWWRRRKTREERYIETTVSSSIYIIFIKGERQGHWNESVLVQVVFFFLLLSCIPWRVQQTHLSFCGRRELQENLHKSFSFTLLFTITILACQLWIGKCSIDDDEERERRREEKKKKSISLRLRLLFSFKPTIHPLKHMFFLVQT